MDKSQADQKQNERAATSEQAQRRARKLATQHALSIEDKKKLRDRVLDLIIEAYDLPSNPSADPADPSPADAQLFHQCLTLFRPSDLDDLVHERNIDDRCGYALCPKQKQGAGSQDVKIWNGKSGKDFALVNRSDLQKWCSPQCKHRTTFVRQQLNNEPAWLRSVQNENIQLLDSFAPETSKDRDNSATASALAAKMQALSLERADLGVNQSSVANVSVLEREPESIPKPPNLGSNELIEGLPTRAHERVTRTPFT